MKDIDVAMCKLKEDIPNLLDALTKECTEGALLYYLDKKALMKYINANGLPKSTQIIKIAVFADYDINNLIEPVDSLRTKILIDKASIQLNKNAIEHNKTFDNVDLNLFVEITKNRLDFLVKNITQTVLYPLAFIYYNKFIKQYYY